MEKSDQLTKTKVLNLIKRLENEKSKHIKLYNYEYASIIRDKVKSLNKNLKEFENN